MSEFPVLLAILLAPVAAALVIAFLPREEKLLIKCVAAAGTFTSMVLAFYAYFTYDTGTGGVQFVQQIPWIKDLGVTFYLGVDGVSLPLMLLISILGFSAVFASWNVDHRPRDFFILLCLLITGVMGTFVVQDLFIFLLFYEVVVIPIYILIIIWGSTKRVTKEYAGMKLTIYLLIGSAFLLVGVVALFMKTAGILGAPDMSFAGLARAAKSLSQFDQIWIFALMLFGFGSLISMWPFHSWSPDGYAGAPTAVSMIHAGVLKKIGGYGLIRIALYILPVGAQFWAPVMAVLGVCGVVYAAMAALAQKDLKYIVGYSSVSHMGYVMLAVGSLSVIGLNGAIAYMFAHGIMAALFFSMIGFIYEKTHTRWIPDLGGLHRQLPKISAGFMLAALATLGLPGLISFIPEFTIFIAAFNKYGGLAVAAIAGIIVTALYALRAGAYALFGPPREEYDHLQDIKGPELVPLVVLGTVLVVGGLLPSLLFNVINCGTIPLMAEINAALQIGGKF